MQRLFLDIRSQPALNTAQTGNGFDIAHLIVVNVFTVLHHDIKVLCLHHPFECRIQYHQNSRFFQFRPLFHNTVYALCQHIRIGDVSAKTSTQNNVVLHNSIEQCVKLLFLGFIQCFGQFAFPPFARFVSI